MGLQVEQNGTVYVTNNTVLLLNSIGEEDEEALICRTDEKECCDNNTGEWLFPDQSIVPKDGTNSTFYCSGRSEGYIFLRRMIDALSPLGTYCCKAPTNSSISETICVILSKYITHIICLTVNIFDKEYLSNSCRYYCLHWPCHWCSGGGQI